MDVDTMVYSAMGYSADLDIYKTQKPYFCNIPCPEGIPQTNHSCEVQENIRFTDMRPALEQYKLDVQGFEVVKHGEKAVDGDWQTDQWIEQVYYPVVKDVLHQCLGNDVRVKIFDHTIRKRDPTIKPGTTGEDVKRQPARAAHIDQTFLSGVNRVKLHMGSEAPQLLQKRFQIINVWKPLFEPLEDYPLGVCDYRSVNVERDLMAADLVFPHYVGEQWYCKYHPEHSWHYLSRQCTNEYLLFKCYESLETGVARFVPHASFENPLTPSGARLRESIEVRCLVFY